MSEEYSNNKKQTIEVLINCVSYQNSRGLFEWLDSGVYSYTKSDQFYILIGQGIKAKIPIKEITLLERVGKIRVSL